MEKILIIEDSKSFRVVLVASIEALTDFECVQADCLESARQILEQDHQSFFCAIVDIHLPDAPNGEAVDLVIQYQNIATIVS